MSINKKKYILILISVLFSINLMGCDYNLPSTALSNKKPNNFYYTSSLMKDLSLEEPKELFTLYMNFYKKKDFSKDDLATLGNFFNSLNSENFIEKPKDLITKPLYKIFITFNKNKYIINVYNENIISIYPWDGSYSMDYIDTSKMYKAYNLYGLCKYLIPE